MQIATMSYICDLEIHINGEETFFLNEKVLTAYSERLKKIIKQEKRRTQMRNSCIEIHDFPGGACGFELISRFCYNNGGITTTVSNVSLLYCSAVFLGMTEKVSTQNLLKQTESFLEGLFYWSWKDIIVCLKSCESLFSYADSFGLLEKLICALLAKIAQNSDLGLIAASSSSSSSSPDTPSGFRLFSPSSKTTSESTKLSSSSKAWWFDDLASLPPQIIEKIIQSLGAFGTDNNSLILTRFLLHYLKLAIHRRVHSRTQPGVFSSKCAFLGLAETAVNGVISAGKRAFSCRALFWVLRILSGFGLSKEGRLGLERLIGELLDEATLDDLMVSGHDRGVYDVNLVIRLIKVFVNNDGVSVQKLKKVGKLVDKYLGEISPDQNLKTTKFLGVAESLPDSARNSYDGVYRAIDIYLEAHPALPFDERSKLCRCLNYKKLSLEVCKELAKNPKIPPRVAIQALISQQSKVPKNELDHCRSLSNASDSQMGSNSGSDKESFAEENGDVKINLQRMQRRVVELESVCKEMKGQMSKLVRHTVLTPTQARALPKLC
ncbi:BTB/POZ domain-containing protein At3g19850 [Ziziphus jujuba]|uniref:BTB/POZ domain-containing protein At3g19850 n=1 Tax=Ziziphus jujuba TaxID=326968 RepID=A0A6P4AKW6_ZIZJJ|nr:BTB/POZ domain-containing protein At3g19850 [Ziziphus jujuba]